MKIPTQIIFARALWEILDKLGGKSVSKQELNSLMNILHKGKKPKTVQEILHAK